MTDPLVDWPKTRLLGAITLGRRHGLDDDQLLAGTGCTVGDISDARTRQPISVEFTVIRNLQRLLPDDLPLGLEAGLDFHVRAACHWGQALRTSELFGEAVTVAIEYVDLSFSLVRIDMVALGGNQLGLRYVTDHLPADVRFFLCLRSAIASSVIARELLGRPMPLDAARAAFPKPPYADAIASIAGTHIEWDADETLLVLDANLLHERLPSFDPKAHDEALENCRLLLQRYRQRDGLAGKLREYLAAAGTDGVSLDHAATALGVSSRTLRRHLTAEGTSFRQLLDDARMELASELFLLGLSVEQTAIRVGYSQPTAFAHAFRRWTGTSPERWRSSLLSERRPAG